MHCLQTISLMCKEGGVAPAITLGVIGLLLMIAAIVLAAQGNQKAKRLLLLAWLTIGIVDFERGLNAAHWRTKPGSAYIAYACNVEYVAILQIIAMCLTISFLLINASRASNHEERFTHFLFILVLCLLTVAVWIFRLQAFHL